MSKLSFDNNPCVAVGRALLHTSRRRFQLSEMRLEEVGIGPGQMPVLGELNRHRKLTQRELAEHTRVTAATISGTLKRMERAGLVKRSEDEADARVSIVELTEKGQNCSDEAIRLFMETDANMMEGFTEEEMSQLLGYLNRMHDNVCRALETAVQSNRKESK